MGKRVHERDWSGVGWGDGAKKMLLAFYVCLVYYFVVHRYAYCCCSNADKHAGSLGKSISSATWQHAVRERERSDLTFALRCINNDAADDDDAVGAENWVENCT